MMHDIAIFVGHAGKDSGAIDGRENDSIYSIETAITQSISSKVSMLLSLLDIRHRQIIGSFDVRLAKSMGCTGGVSIHADVSTDTKTHGYHVMYYPYSSKGKALATCIDTEMLCAADRARKIHPRDNLAVLKKTRFPCALIEVGFLSNIIEESRLYIESYQFSIAISIVHGIRKWMAEND